MSKPPRRRPSFVTTDDEDDMPSPWAVTMADMFTLLMCFFILLFAVSSLDSKRFDNILSAVQGALGGIGGSGGVMLQGGAPGGKAVKPKSLDELTGLEEESLLQDMRQEFKGRAPDESMQITMRGNQVVLQVGGQVLFTPGSSTLAPQAQGFLDRVVRVAKNYPDYRVDIKGHTDPRPISTAKFESNWELSSLRATAVLRYLIDRGVSPKRLTATGYADTQPLVSNTSEENMAKNRRVEFVLEKKEK
ncbi:MAG: OmpA family protein [Desulfarculus sp.]|nr:OmpA family protein [Desulfarculus sp.]